MSTGRGQVMGFLIQWNQSKQGDATRRDPPKRSFYFSSSFPFLYPSSSSFLRVGICLSSRVDGIVSIGAVRAELSVKLGLSDLQLQMWFGHRRLKDRKTPPMKRRKKEETSLAVVESHQYQHHQQPRGVGPRGGAAIARIAIDMMPAVKRYYQSPQAISELRAIAFVEAQLGEPLREDRPILGMEFDPLPPGAFGAPIGKLGFLQLWNVLLLTHFKVMLAL
ncbi:hypothetical protein Vadar_031807 [Vaccinium darrowii]|uniref:Uncharacterized protein n=1 Tax=Vaccinium darrowii TaxID=229202 RepID=A0ACB7ZGR9_9ERIC|nr:hypothetical protein Vadar_031807 [Vaccinium darrowii]